MWIWLGVFVVGAVSQYYTEVWSIRHTNLSTAPVKLVTEAAMGRRIRRAQHLGLALLLLGAVDVGSVFGGIGAVVAVYAGSALGVWLGTARVMWDRWRRKRKETEREREREAAGMAGGRAAADGSGG